jgi:hypothetical protein
MILTAIGLIIGWILGWALLSIGSHIIAYRKESKAIEMAIKSDPFDSEGHRKEFDAHYARQLEIEGGVRVTTQCEDNTCKTCYWKARKLDDYDAYSFAPGGALLKKRQQFIKDLPDGMSDDLYEMMYEDWEQEMMPLIKQNRLSVTKERERKRRQKDEEYYATPYHLIQQYKAEGRTYDPVAGWSRIPKDWEKEMHYKEKLWKDFDGYND